MGNDTGQISAAIQMQKDDPGVFLETLFGDIDEGFVSISIKPLDGRWQDNYMTAPLSELDPSIRRLGRAEAGVDVYATVAPRRTNARGTAANTLSLTALWIELDSTGSSIGKQQDPGSYFATLEEAKTFVNNSAPWKPTMIVDSGHGWHFYWKLTEPVTEGIEELLAAWRGLWETKAGAAGKRLDPVFDSARVMRVPGTWNMKGQPTEVSVAHVDPDARYDASEILDFIPPTERLRASTYASALAEPSEVDQWIKARSNGWDNQGREYVVGLVDDMRTASERHPTVKRLLASLLQSNRAGVDSSEAIEALREEFKRRVSGEHRFEDEFDDLVAWIVSQRLAEAKAPESEYVVEDRSATEPMRTWTEVDEVDQVRYEIPSNRELWDTDDGTGIPPELQHDIYHGPIGDLLRFWEGRTEPLTPTIAVELFARISTYVGRRPHHLLPDGSTLRLNWWGLLIGTTALSRKGTAQDVAERSMPPDAIDLRIANGIGSGQRLIELVADPVSDLEGNVTGGYTDQRLLVDEPEFAAILNVGRYTGSTLSSTMRKLYDGKPVSNEVKSGSSHATNYHMNVVGAITPTELRNLLDDTSIANGFANRFQWFAGVDSIDIPLAIGAFPEAELAEIRDQLGRNITQALAGNCQIKWSPDAAEMWHDAYTSLKRLKGTETVRSLLARVTNHTIKLAALYAIADGQTEIAAVHLTAALAWARYSIETVQWVYTAADADEWSRRILEVTRARPGLPVNVSVEIHRQAFSGPKRPASGEIWARIEALESDGWLHVFSAPPKPGGGRPARYVIATKPRIGGNDRA